MKVILKFLTNRKGVIFFLLLLLIFINVFLLIKLPIKHAFEYNPDEGLNLTKAMLFLNGFSLYKEISANQPPFFTLIISNWFKLFGQSAYSGRILVFIFSTILLFALYQIIRMQWGYFCAFVAIIFLMLSSAYLKLSASIMIGIPSLSLATMSVLSLMFYKKNQKNYWLVLSGALMALSLQTKLFTAFLIPLILFELTQIKVDGFKGLRQRKRLFSPALLWFVSLLIVSLAFIAVFFRFNFQLLIHSLLAPHFKETVVPHSGFSVIWKMILEDYDIFLLALLGIILLVRQEKWQFFFPVLWLSIAFLILLEYSPLWHHHYLLISIPLCWLAAISFSAFFHKGMEKMHLGRIDKNDKSTALLGFITAVLVIITILRVPYKLNHAFKSLSGGITAEECKVMELLKKYKKYTRYIYTDRKIFAFYSEIPIPPELALTSWKRGFIEPQAQEYLINKLQQYRPELILLDRLGLFGQQVISFIENTYTEIYQGNISQYMTVKTHRGIQFFNKIKMSLERMWPVNRREPYRIMYRLLGEEARYNACYRLIETLDEMIESYDRLSAGVNTSNPNDISLLTIHQNGRFEIKSYHNLPDAWQKKFPDQASSFFAYQVFKKIFKEWHKEKGKLGLKGESTGISSKIAQLKLLKERITQEIKTGVVINSFNPSGPIIFDKITSRSNIRLYIRKDLMENLN